MVTFFIVKDVRDQDPANHRVRVLTEMPANDPRPIQTVSVSDGILADAAITHLSSLVSSMKRDLGSEAVIKIEIGR